MEDMFNSGIYLITNTVNSKCYVGSSMNLTSRSWRHQWALRAGRHENEHLQRAWTCYGSGAFLIEVVQYCDEAGLLRWEDWWMELLDSRNQARGYNLCFADRHAVTPVVRGKISAGLKGRTVSEETRARISLANTGKRRSEESRARMSTIQRGRVVTVSERASKSEALKGKPWSEERRASHVPLGAEARAQRAAAVSAATKGRAKSPEHRAALSASRRGKPWSQARWEAHERKKSEQ